jgi:hypothetical protein
MLCLWLVISSHFYYHNRKMSRDLSFTTSLFPIVYILNLFAASPCVHTRLFIYQLFKRFRLRVRDSRLYPSVEYQETLQNFWRKASTAFSNYYNYIIYFRARVSTQYRILCRACINPESHHSTDTIRTRHEQVCSTKWTYFYVKPLSVKYMLERISNGISQNTSSLSTSLSSLRIIPWSSC